MMSEKNEPEGNNDTKHTDETTIQQHHHNNNTPENEPPKDEEGLLLKYDVIICGTGLVQSILASALTRAGKTVLHCDGNDHYGELDTVWTFDYLQELIQKKQSRTKNTPREFTDNSNNNSNDNDNDTDSITLSPRGAYQSLQFHSSQKHTSFTATEIDAQVHTPYGPGRVVHKRLPTSNNNDNNNNHGSLAVALTNWTLANGTSPIVYMGVAKEQVTSSNDNNNNNNNDTSNDDKTIDNNEDQTVVGMEAHFALHRKQDIKSQRTILAERILEQHSRSLALDVSPMLLYASGSAVRGFLTSGVCDHLEFQTMQAVYWLQLDSNDKSSTAQLERVPCSKGDVFQSTLLPPLDKRRFMTFFQLAMDYATERELVREQERNQMATSVEGPTTTATATTTAKNNDDATTDTNTDEGVLSLNERRLNQGRSLARPQNKAISKNDLQTLMDCMDQNLDFETYLKNHAKLSAQLRTLIRHSLALEYDGRRQGAFVGSSLSTLDGMGRLCDHLKALGRYGTTAFLTPLYGSGEMSQFFCRSAAVYGATYLLRRVPSVVKLNSKNDNGTSQQREVEGVVIRSSDEVDKFISGSTVDIPKEKFIKASHVVIAQEATLSVPTQRRLLRRISVLRGSLVPSVGRSVIIIPPHGVGDHPYAIHGLVLDETARVAPSGCSVLHLTTVIDKNTGENVGDVLKDSLEVILASSASTSSGDAVDEIFHATFSYDVYDEPSNESGDDDGKVKGLHVVHRLPMQMVCDGSFEQARRIFHDICGPDEEFMALSQRMQAKLKEQLQDAYRGPNQTEDDTDQVVLDSAMEMLS